jgi:hypothetical protein
MYLGTFRIASSGFSESYELQRAIHTHDSAVCSINNVLSHFGNGSEENS